MKNLIYGIIFTLTMIEDVYSNEMDIKKIKDNHNSYYKHLFENDMDSLAKLFSFPSLFKGFVSEVQIFIMFSSYLNFNFAHSFFRNLFCTNFLLDQIPNYL